MALHLKLWRLAEALIPEEELKIKIAHIYRTMPRKEKCTLKNNENPTTTKICLIKTPAKILKIILKIPHKTEGPVIINGKIQWSAIMLSQHLDWVEFALEKHLAEVRHEILSAENNHILKKKILEHDVDL